MTPALFPDAAEVDRLLVGPESVTWRFASDARLYAVMLYPLLLQVAHPTVGAGVRDYSNFAERPWDRLWRTLDYVNLLVYGGENAAAAGRRLRALHKRFSGIREDGERYYALEPSAYAWVHATLIETYVAGHRTFGRPMGADEVERFYREYRGLGRLIGVREDDLPGTWAGFRDYFAAMTERELTRTRSVDEVLGSVRNAVAPVRLPPALWRALRLPAQRSLWVGGIGLMAPALRDRLGITWTRRDERDLRMISRASRSLTPVLPETLRVMGPTHLRLRRRAIVDGPLGPAADQRTSDRAGGPPSAAAAG